MGPAGVYQMPGGVMFFYSLTDGFLYNIHIKWRQKLAIGHGIKTILVTTNTNKLLNMRIPGCYIVIAYWPRNAVTIAFGVGKLVGTPALACPAPGKGLTPNLVAPYPIKRLFLYIGVVFIFYKKMGIVFTIAGGFAD